MGVVSVDGSEFEANAAKHRSVTYERAGGLIAQLEDEIAALLGRAEAADAAGEEDPQALPQEIARREALRDKLDAARRRLEAQARARAAAERGAYEAKLAAREKRRGRARGKRPKPPDETPGAGEQSNLSDPDSRLMGVAPETFLDLQRQRVHAAPHVGHATRQPDANPARNRDHRRARTERTRPSAAPSTSRSTITREPSENAISIRPVVGTAPVSASGGGGSMRSGSTTTGTKPPCSRNRRRQLKTRFAFTSLRRATTETDTPGWSLSATIRRFSASLQRRRGVTGRVCPDPNFSNPSDMCDRVHLAPGGHLHGVHFRIGQLHAITLPREDGPTRRLTNRAWQTTENRSMTQSPTG